MKKNLLSVLILALLVVNLVLTGIMMFSVTGAMKSTTSLVKKIATVLDMELEPGTSGNTVDVADQATYDLGDITVLLKNEEGDNGQHYAMFSITLLMNAKDKDYATYSVGLADRVKVIEAEIEEVVSCYTLDEFMADKNGITSEILARLQRMYNSEFIYDVKMSGVKAY